MLLSWQAEESFSQAGLTCDALEEILSYISVERGEVLVDKDEEKVSSWGQAPLCEESNFHELSSWQGGLFSLALGVPLKNPMGREEVHTVQLRDRLTMPEDTITPGAGQDTATLSPSALKPKADLLPRCLGI